MTDRIDPDRIDPAFRALPLARLADAALGRARERAPSTPTSGSSGSCRSRSTCATPA